MSFSEPATSPQILQIPRLDEPDTYVLLHVSRPDPTVLNLDIAATEGENPYTGSVRQSRLKNARAKNYQGSDEEWIQAVAYALGQLPATNGIPDWASGIETSASIAGSGDDDSEVTITIRKRIQTITQKLGNITLKQDDEAAIELFAWSGIAVTKADTLGRQLSTLTHRFREAEDTIQQLNKQLEELISAKSQHENQLVANFAQLLNEKKLKIRNQQRLLASAKVDEAKVSEIQAATSDKPSRSTEKGRPKRTARAVSDDESDSDGFEKMDVEPTGPKRNQQEDETDDEPSTPQPLEDEENTETDEDEDEESSPPPIAKDKARDVHKGRNVESDRPVMKEAVPPPPRRELPFARRNQERKTQAQSHQPQEDAEETGGETDDDEL